MSANAVRRGKLTLTQKQLNYLKVLAEGHKNETPFVAIPIRTKLDEKTLRNMQKQDFIFETRVIEGERRFGITSRDLSTLAVFLAPSREQAPKTEMCFKCGERPRYKKANWEVAYCQECHNALNRLNYALRGGHGYDPKKKCSRCKKARRSVSANGQVYAYCEKCRKAVNDETRLRRLARMKKAKEEGTLPLCSKCHANPIHVTDFQASLLCLGCLAKYKRLERRRVKGRKFGGKAALYKRA